MGEQDWDKTKWSKLIVEKERDGMVAKITLNYPEKLNCLDFPGQGGLTDQFHGALSEIEKDGNVKVVLIKGSGRGFGSGHDLSKVGFIYGMKAPESGKSMEVRPSQRIRLDTDREFMHKNYLHLLYYPKITIAQVHGICQGESLFFATMCDLTIAAENAQLGLPQARLGFAGSGGPNLLLFWLSMGMKKTLELILTARIISGKEADEMGMISKAVPEDRLEEVVDAYVQLICLLPRDGISIGKASRHLLYETMGLTKSVTIGYITHTMFTNLSYQPDEFIFFRARRDKGTTGAIEARNKLWDDLIEKIYGPKK